LAVPCGNLKVVGTACCVRTLSMLGITSSTSCTHDSTTYAQQSSHCQCCSSAFEKCSSRTQPFQSAGFQASRRVREGCIQNTTILAESLPPSGIPVTGGFWNGTFRTVPFQHASFVMLECGAPERGIELYRIASCWNDHSSSGTHSVLTSGMTAFQNAEHPLLAP